MVYEHMADAEWTYEITHSYYKYNHNVYPAFKNV